jgi:uncharacterized protein YxeA
MKKVTLILVAVLISAITFSQTFYKVTQCSYNVYENEWKTQETNYPDKMFVIVNKSNIKITNESESNFILYGEMKTNNYSTHTAYTWSAYDKEGSQCKVMFKVNKGEGNGICYLSVLYGLICYDYILNIQN